MHEMPINNYRNYHIWVCYSEDCTFFYCDLNHVDIYSVDFDQMVKSTPSENPRAKRRRGDD